MPERAVQRGEVYLADLSARGGRLWKVRPVVIVQNDMGNRHSTETIVAALRDSQGEKMLPVLVFVPRGTGGVSKDSLVDAGHVLTYHQDSLGRPIGRLPADLMRLVDRALRISLAL